MKIGDTVTWVSQSQGYEKEKVGVVIEFIPSKKSGYAFLPKDTKKSHIKFGDYSIIDRVLVEVKAGANKNISYYYAPFQRELERQGN